METVGERWYGVYMNSILSSQLFYKSKTILKFKNLFKKYLCSNQFIKKISEALWLGRNLKNHLVLVCF